MNKMTMKTVAEIDGTTFDAYSGEINQTFLGVEDHGAMAVLIELYDRRTGETHSSGYRMIGGAYGMELVTNLIRVLGGVGTWENLIGEPAVLLRSPDDRNGPPVAIANPTTNEVVFFNQDHPANA